MYEEKIFKESEIAGFEFEPENIVFDWLGEKLHEMIKEHYDFSYARYSEGCGGFYKISIERLDSKEELEQAQDREQQFL